MNKTIKRLEDESTLIIKIQVDMLFEAEDKGIPHSVVVGSIKFKTLEALLNWCKLNIHLCKWIDRFGKKL